MVVWTGGKRGDYQKCSVRGAVHSHVQQLLQFCGLGFVSLYIDSFCVYFMCFNTAYLLYYCERGGVDLMALNPNPKDPIFLQCFDTVDCIFLFFFLFLSFSVR